MYSNGRPLEEEEEDFMFNMEEGQNGALSNIRIPLQYT
jgi:hypothetical protein